MSRSRKPSKSYSQLYDEAADNMMLGAYFDSLRREYCRWPYGVDEWLFRERQTAVGGAEVESDPARLQEIVVSLLECIRDLIGRRERYGLPDSLVLAIRDALIAVGHDDIGEFRPSSDAEAAVDNIAAGMKGKDLREFIIGG